MMHEVNLLQQLGQSHTSPFDFYSCHFSTLSSLPLTHVHIHTEHPNIIKCEGWFWQDMPCSGAEDKSILFIVLEYLSGGDMQKKIASRRARQRFYSEKHIWLALLSLHLFLPPLFPKTLSPQVLIPSDLQCRLSPARKWHCAPRPENRKPHSHEK